MRQPYTYRKLRHRYVDAQASYTLAATTVLRLPLPPGQPEVLGVAKEPRVRITYEAEDEVIR